MGVMLWYWYVLDQGQAVISETDLLERFEVRNNCRAAIIVCARWLAAGQAEIHLSAVAVHQAIGRSAGDPCASRSVLNLPVAITPTIAIGIDVIERVPSLRQPQGVHIGRAVLVRAAILRT
jgi:hypothetical protein